MQKHTSPTACEALVFQDQTTQNPNFIQPVVILAFDGPAPMTDVGI
jgi:hypothetical protein